MHKLLIVDDDVMYRYAVRSLLEGTGGDYRILPEAINGRHALDLIKEERPDLIITDISMPEMNGVDLIKRVKADSPEIKILVLSAYDDFVFVKDALKSGAEDYLLKYELEEADFGAVVKGLCAKLDRERAERRELAEEALRRVLSGEAREAAKTCGILRCLFPGRGDGPFAVAAVRPLAGAAGPAAFEAASDALKRLADENGRCRFVRLPERTLFAVVFDLSFMERDAVREGTAALAKKAAARIEGAGGLRVCLGVAGPFPEEERLAERFREAELLAERGFYLDASEIVFGEAGAGPSAAPEVRDPASAFRAVTAGLVRLLDAVDEAGAAEAVSELFLLLRRERPPLGLLEDVTAAFFSDFFLLLKKRRFEFEAITGLNRCPPRLGEIAASFAELERFLSGCLSRFFAAVNAPARDYRREVAGAMEYIRDNYRKGFELADLAGRLGFSPNYLCSLFKKETGMRLFEYLNKVRIAEAVKLLSSTNLKVYEIAEKTGFKTESYLCQTFREVMGRSISEYRKTLG